MKGVGTAVCVAPGCFVTARHVIADNDEGLPPELRVNPERVWVYLETDKPLNGDPSGVHGGLMDVTWANAHSETDLATLTVNMLGESAHWLTPVTLGLQMPDIGEPVAALGYNHLLAEGAVHDGPVKLTFRASPWRADDAVIARQHERRLGAGLHRTSPGFSTDAVTPHGFSGGPVFDTSDEVIGFTSGANEPSPAHPKWDTFVSGTAAALELNFKLPPGGTDAQEHNWLTLSSPGKSGAMSTAHSTSTRRRDPLAISRRLGVERRLGGSFEGRDPSQCPFDQAHSTGCCLQRTPPCAQSTAG